MKGMVILPYSDVYKLVVFPLDRTSPMRMETNKEEVEVQEMVMVFVEEQLNSSKICFRL